MKTPPFLLGAALLFWGWQSDLLWVGLAMGVVLESARWVKVRWDFSPQDFNRIWTFCALLFFAAAVYAFTSNDVPTAFSNFLQNPSVGGSHNAGTATSRAAAAWIRWQPMVFFLFLAAQTFNGHEGVPVETVSVLMKLRWKTMRGPGAAATSGRTVNVSYPYVGVCLLAASAHTSENHVFFWGLAVLLAWALWPLGSPRFSRVVWVATLALGIALGFCGQRGLGLLQRYIENLNPQWPFRFSRSGTDPLQSRTAIGRIGRLKLSGKIVIRLEAQAGVPPTYLREASYRLYRTQVWSSETGTNDFTSVSDPNGSSYVLVPGKTNTAGASIACYLPGGSGLLPLPEGCGQVDNRLIYGVEKSPLGAVVVHGPGLVMFDAHYGPGATMDAPPSEDDLLLGRETNALDQVMAELHPEGLSREAKLQALRAFFLNHFTYSTWQGPPRLGGTNESPLTRFLLHNRRGHCEYFATAGVLMLRRMNIPARYAVGYAVHEGAGRKYVVRERDAHAWCLAWNEATQTWEDFECTPASWIKEEGARASFFQPLSDAWSRVWFEFSKFRWGQSRVREYVLWALVPVLGLLLYQILFRSQRRRRRANSQSGGLLEAWPGSDSEFYLLEAKVRERGLARAPGEPLSRWLSRAAADPALADLNEPLQTLLRLHYRLRFDPLGLEPAEREALRREATACLAKLAGGAD
jgi:protein-glutamine gamma-glutamyltransferase